MSEDQSNIETPKETETKRVVVSKYSRPIEFISEGSVTNVNDNKREKVESNGDEIASMYRSILTTTSKKVGQEKKESLKKRKTVSEDSVWCEICSQSVPISDNKRHIQGTAHMVSNNHESIPDTLTLNGSNVGFRMMKSQGWKYEEGLGPEGQGRRLPISTVLKQDRLCIGHKETGRKVVTHKYKDIEKTAIKRQRMEMESRKDPGKEIARKAKAETERRNAILRYMKN